MTEEFTHEIVTLEDGAQFDLVRDSQGRPRALIDGEGEVVMDRYYSPSVS